MNKVITRYLFIFGLFTVSFVVAMQPGSVPSQELTERTARLWQEISGPGKNHDIKKYDMFNIVTFLSNGADLSSINQKGNTFLTEAIFGEKDPEIIKLFLLAGASPNQQDGHGKLPLLEAVKKYKADYSAHSFGAVKLLLERGAFVFLQDRSGQSVLNQASKTLAFCEFENLFKEHVSPAQLDWVRKQYVKRF